MLEKVARGNRRKRSREETARGNRGREALEESQEESREGSVGEKYRRRDRCKEESLEGNAGEIARRKTREKNRGRKSHAESRRKTLETIATRKCWRNIREEIAGGNRRRKSQVGSVEES